MRDASAASPLTAETIAIGTELLIGGRSEANSLFLADELGQLGIEVRFKSVVGDVQSDIALAISHAVKRAGVVVMTGGLGPTVDDRTREAIAQVTGRRLSKRKEALDSIRARLAEWGRTPNQRQLRQAMIPSGATVLANPVGSAPGFCLTWKRCFIVALPGVPSEMEAMMVQEAIPLLKSRLEEAEQRGRPIVRQVFHTFGLPEADVDARLKGLIPQGMPIDLGLLASPMGILVSLTTRSGPRKWHLTGDPLESIAQQVRSRLREWVFAEGRETMEEVVGRLLTKQGLTVAVAESCTGGLIGHRLTQVPGSSSYLDRGIVCYSNRSKTELLGVPTFLLEQHGAVSASVAASMANGIRERSGTDIGLSVTGIAGPDGGTATKPVGLVFVGLDGGEGDPMTKEFRFHGDRNMIKQRSSQAALDMLRRWLIARCR